MSTRQHYEIKMIESNIPTKCTDEGRFGMINSDFFLRDIAGSDANRLAEGTVGSAGRSEDPFALF